MAIYIDPNDVQFKRALDAMSKAIQETIDRMFLYGTEMGPMYVDKFTQRLTEEMVLRFGNLPLQLSVRSSGDGYLILFQEAVPVSPVSPGCIEMIECHYVLVPAALFRHASLTLSEEYEIIKEEVFLYIHTNLIEKDEDDDDD